MYIDMSGKICGSGATHAWAGQNEHVLTCNSGKQHRIRITILDIDNEELQKQ